MVHHFFEGEGRSYTFCVAPTKFRLLKNLMFRNSISSNDNCLLNLAKLKIFFQIFTISTAYAGVGVFTHAAACIALQYSEFINKHLTFAFEIPYGSLTVCV